MSDHLKEREGFDVRLAAHFEQEHGHIPGDAFVAATMQKVRTERRRREFMRTGLRIAAVVAIVAASPWLIAGVSRLNAALESSFSWATGLPGSWVLGVLAVFVVLAMRRRRRSR
jgi:hypothetical protein